MGIANPTIADPLALTKKPEEEHALSGSAVLPSGEDIDSQNRRLSDFQTSVKSPVSKKKGGDPGAGAKPVESPMAVPTRMGIGPGGAALSFDQALKMLEAPANIGEVKEALQTGQTGSQQMYEQFQQAAGSPLQYGARERGIIDKALLPYAQGQEKEKEEAYSAAREVINRTYKGPAAMGEKVEGQPGRSDYQKTRDIASGAQIGAEAMGTGRGRAALLRESAGLSSGQAAAEAARLHGQPGYTRGVRETAGEAGESYAEFEKKRQETEVQGVMSEIAGGIAATSAWTDLGDRQDQIVAAAGRRTEAKQEELDNAREHYAAFMESGDMSELQGLVNTSVFDGHLAAVDARAAWEEIWTNEQFATVSDHPPLGLGTHYTGQQMLIPSDISVEKWRNDRRYSTFTDWVWDNMRGITGTSASRPGRWLHSLRNAARASINTEHANQARGFLAELQKIYSRQKMLEGKFSPALPSLLRSGQDVRGDEHSIESPSQVSAYAPGTYTGRGHYSTGILRPGGGNVRGEFAGEMPLYLGRPGSGVPFTDLRERDPETGSSSFITGPEGGMPTNHSEMTEDDVRRFNVLENLRNGQSPYDGEAGQPMTAEMSTNLSALIEYEQKAAATRGQVLNQQEAMWSTVKRFERAQFVRGYEYADQDFWDYAEEFYKGYFVGAFTGLLATGNPYAALAIAIAAGAAQVTTITGRSRDYKRAPSATRLGVRQVPDEAYWEANYMDTPYIGEGGELDPEALGIDDEQVAATIEQREE